MLLATVNLVALILPMAVVAVVGFVYLRARRRLRPDDAREIPQEPTFAERSLDEVERAFERLIAEGRIEVEKAPLEDRTRRAVPQAGPVLRRVLDEYRVIRLVESDLSLDLRRIEAPNDPIGGWRMRASDDAVDIRIGVGPSGEAVLDATWSPTQGGEIMRHSTILHFVVRAVAGDRI